VYQSAGSKWYANLPLQHGPTRATVAFQNGSLERPIQVQWVPLDLSTYTNSSFRIRVGDNLKLTLHKGSGGIVSAQINGATRSAPDTEGLIFHQFTQAGTYPVSVTWTKNGQSETAALTIEVIGGTFPEERPACLVGRTRTWSFSGMDTNVVLEADASVDMTSTAGSIYVVETQADGTLVTNTQEQITVNLTAHKTNGKHIMLARLYENGPILASTQLDTFWVQNAVDGYFWTVERFEDSELWEVESIAKNLPDTVDLKIQVIIAGVTLDDYTLSRWLTAADYDDLGEYKFRLFHPNARKSSTCHTFKLYQDGQFIGESFNNGQTNIGEK